jgi:hypothetical protein
LCGPPTRSVGPIWQVGGSSSRPDPLVGDDGELGRWGRRGTHFSQALERGVGVATLESS